MTQFGESKSHRAGTCCDLSEKDPSSDTHGRTYTESRTFLTDSGVRIFYDWREAVKIDCDLAAICAKADPAFCDGKDRFSHGKARGYSRICSEHSEDRLTWIFFRSLERSAHAPKFLKWCFPSWPVVCPQMTSEFLYWGRLAEQPTIDQKVNAALALLEPHQRANRTQHTETDLAIRMPAGRIMVEAKLRRPAGTTGWEKSRKDPYVRAQYQVHANKLLKHCYQKYWQDIVREFYQPMRNLMLGSLLEDDDLSRVGLLLIVNSQKGTQARIMYESKLLELRDALVLPPSQLTILSWHDLVLWARQFGGDLKTAVCALERNPLLANFTRMKRTEHG